MSGSTSSVARRGRPPRSSKGKSLDGQRSRDPEVVEAAVQLFHRKGYASTSIQDLADALGMLKGSLYYYIDTKETLLRHIFETSHEQMQAVTEEHRTSDLPAIERFRAYLRSYAMWYLTNLPRASLFAREWRHVSEELQQLMVEQRRHYDLAIRQLASEARAEAEADLGQDDLSMMCAFIMSAVSSLPDWFKTDGNRSAEEVADLYVTYGERVVLGGRAA